MLSLTSFRMSFCSCWASLSGCLAPLLDLIERRRLVVRFVLRRGVAPAGDLLPVPQWIALDPSHVGQCRDTKDLSSKTESVVWWHSLPYSRCSRHSLLHRSQLSVGCVCVRPSH
jgi:hypothetical protein